MLLSGASFCFKKRGMLSLLTGAYAFRKGSLKGKQDMRISLKSWEWACRLQKQTPVVDLHLDLPGELLFLHQAGKRHVLRDRYLPVWHRTGICLIGAAVYVEDRCLPESGLRNALLQIEALTEELAELEEEMCLVRSLRELEQAYRKEKIGILLYAEGLDYIGTEAALLEMLHELGVMGASLTWSRRNMLACGCCRAGENKNIRGGITEAGLQVMKRMQKMHMFLDISHLNDDGMQEVLEKTELPVLATHSNAREVYEHYRNLTKGQLELLSGRGGIVGLNACSLLTGSEKNRKHLEMLQKHSRYLLEKMGREGVCLGLDLCRNYELASKEGREEDAGHDALAGYDELVLLTAVLLEGGIEEQAVKGLLGENAFAFLKGVLPKE